LRCLFAALFLNVFAGADHGSGSVLMSWSARNSDRGSAKFWTAIRPCSGSGFAHHSPSPLELVEASYLVPLLQGPMPLRGWALMAFPVTRACVPAGFCRHVVPCPFPSPSVASLAHRDSVSGRCACTLARLDGFALGSAPEIFPIITVPYTDVTF
jgi:hypothetical protein